MAEIQVALFSQESNIQGCLQVKESIRMQQVQIHEIEVFNKKMAGITQDNYNDLKECHNQIDFKF